uniref:proteasome endopeptidase complex n=1 Tax=Cacopsylla melanoneura TaxID=428564 RepID=A0A8D8RI72_9HEMI
MKPTTAAHLPQEVSCGTTTIACEFDRGVILAADSRTSLGTYVTNRDTDKLTRLTDNVYCACSGWAGDAQAVTDRVIYRLELDVADGYRQASDVPSVYRVAKVFQNILGERTGYFKASFIVAGWDVVKGSQIYALPSSGVLTSQSVACGGSGSAYILGYVENQWRCGMKQKECLAFVRTTLSLAMNRDYATGGYICVCVMELGKLVERIVLQPVSPNSALV